MPTYIRSLDGLRALAVALVMMFHFQLLPIGWIGVQIFFVLSGYLITRILLHEKQHSLSFYLKRFYWRRTIRIFPIYFTYLILIAAAFMVMGMPADVKEKLPYLFTYTYNYTRISADWSHSPLFTHLWSLSVEEQFYMIWPLAIFIFSKKQLRYIIPAVIVAGPLVRYFIGEWLINLNNDTEAVGEAIYWFTFSHFDAFAIGGAITLFKLNEHIPKTSWLFITSLAIVVTVGLSNWYSITEQGHAYELSSLGYAVGSLANYQYVWSYSLLNLCFGLLILALIKLGNSSSFHPLAIFNTKFMVSAGRVSYGMYLYHWAIMAVFFKVAKPFVGKGWLSFALYFMVVYAVAWLSFKFYESWFLAFKDKYFTHKKVKAG